MRIAGIALVTFAAVTSGGCFLGGKKPVVQTPPPPQPAIVQPPSLPKVQSNEEPPIQVLEKPVEEPPPPPVLAPPPNNPNHRPNTARQTTPLPAQQPPAPEPVAPTPPSAAPPIQLGEILTPEMRRQYEAEFAQQMNNARAAVDQVEAKRLSAAQRDAVTRIRTFISQAQSAHDKDIVTALQLIRRADLLGQDLIKSVP